MVSAAAGKRTNFPRGTRPGSKWSSFDDGYYHDALFPATTKKHDDDLHVTTDSVHVTHADDEQGTRVDVGLNNTATGSIFFPRTHVFRHYIIYSFTQNIIVANMSLMSEISGPYRVMRPCVMRFSRFRFEPVPRLRADLPFSARLLFSSPEVADTSPLNESLSQATFPGTLAILFFASWLNGEFTG